MKKNTGSKKQDEIILKIKQGPIGRYNLTKQQTKQVTLFSCVRLSGISCSMYSMRRDSASRTYFWILPPSLSEEFYGFFKCYWKSYLLNLKFKILQADKPPPASGMFACS